VVHEMLHQQMVHKDVSQSENTILQSGSSESLGLLMPRKQLKVTPTPKIDDYSDLNTDIMIVSREEKKRKKRLIIKAHFTACLVLVITYDM
jgi:hypothetical protein